MKKSIRSIFVLLAVVLSLVAIQTVWAEEITVTGTIERIGAASIDVVSDGTTYTFYDISLTDLATQSIVLVVGDSVTVSAYVVTFPNGTVKNIAYSITKGEVTYTWHPKVPKAGTNTVTLSATDENGKPCNCECIENTVCLECNCYCGGKGR
ncbi:MAG: hypothetical protein H6Q92_795 [Nitrospirae bacterium]|jgi:hypothetical protein|nr:hypothetical protein [Nitrospirota bacterium]